VKSTVFYPLLLDDNVQNISQNERVQVAVNSRMVFASVGFGISTGTPATLTKVLRGLS
jgi:hypothetical protein